MKKGDFIEFNYTGKTKEGAVFDTTIKSIGEKLGLKQTFKPIIICLGEGQTLPGLDQKLLEKEIGKHTIELKPEEAFGKKDAKLIQLVSLSKFKKDGLNPFPGMQINVDDQLAIVKRVSGGRVLVDFNNPLAGQEVIYDIEILRTIDDTDLKLASYIANTFGNVKHELKDNVATLYVHTEVPEEIAKKFNEQFKKIIPELKEVKFKIEKENKEE